MKKFKCPMCGEDYIYPYELFDESKYPKTCGKKECEVNLKYQKERTNIHGEKMDPEDIKKW